MNLSSDQFDQIAKKNLANIIQKSVDGKTLSKAELELLHELTPETAEQKKLTQVELAKILGVSRKTLNKLQRENDGPKSNDLEEWRQFLTDRAVSNRAHLDHHLPEELAEWKKKLIIAQAGKEDALCKLKELQLEREKRDLVPMSEAKNAVNEILIPLKQKLEALPKSVAISANPADPVMAEMAVEKEIIKILNELSNEKPRSSKKKTSRIKKASDELSGASRRSNRTPKK
jgi:transcriptional regulator with XRE-family HTH domain